MKGKKLRCISCGREIATPRCCKLVMEVKGDVLRCSICGDRNEIPVHCGKEMKVR